MTRVVYETKHGSKLKDAIQVIKEILRDTNLFFKPIRIVEKESPSTGEKYQVTEGGINLLDMDPAHICIVHLNLRNMTPDEYQCDEQTIAGIDLATFYKALNIMNSDSTLRLVIDSAKNEDQMNVEIINSGQKKIVGLRLLDLNSEQLEMPFVEFDNRATMFTSRFAEIMSNFKNLGATEVTIECRDKSLIFRGGDDMSKTTIVLDSDQGNPAGGAGRDTTNNNNNSRPNASSLLADDALADQGGTGHDGSAAAGDNRVLLGDPETKKAYSMKFRLSYLNTIASKSTKLCQSVDLYFKNDFPIIIRYKIGTEGTVKYMIAPVIDEDDDDGNDDDAGGGSGGGGGGAVIGNAAASNGGTFVGGATGAGGDHMDIA